MKGAFFDGGCGEKIKGKVGRVEGGSRKGVFGGVGVFFFGGWGGGRGNEAVGAVSVKQEGMGNQFDMRKKEACSQIDSLVCWRRDVAR
jgi:hypothetical protein